MDADATDAAMRKAARLAPLAWSLKEDAQRLEEYRWQYATRRVGLPREAILCPLEKLCARCFPFLTDYCSVTITQLETYLRAWKTAKAEKRMFSVEKYVANSLALQR
jgi:hypothetical protein